MSKSSKNHPQSPLSSLEILALSKICVKVSQADDEDGKVLWLVSSNGEIFGALLIDKAAREYHTVWEGVKDTNGKPFPYLNKPNLN